MNWTEPKVYAVVHKDETVRAASRSGGVFTALSDEVLKECGVVYGCVLDENFQAIHIRADNKETRNQMRGSKYIQSRLGDTYRYIEADLKSGRQVLFSGTSCQVAGLKKFLGMDYPNLLCVDIVCHGVPSPFVWQEYIAWQEKKTRRTVRTVEFRNKQDFGWRDHVETLVMDNGKKVSSRVFKNLFYGHNVLRPCCYECRYKDIMHPGDITIADYWGIEKAAPDFDDNKGVSLVLLNNDKGEAIFEVIKESINWRLTRIEDSMQPPLKEPFPRPTERDLFWKDLRTKDFEYIAKKYADYGFTNMLKKNLRLLKHKLFG